MKRNWIWLLQGILVAAAVVSLAGALKAQIAFSNISGLLKDSSGAVVQGVTITAVNADTGLKRSDTTDADGHFNIINLPPGNYRITVSQTGFAALTRDVVLLVGQSPEGRKVDLPYGIVEVGQTKKVGPDRPLGVGHFIPC